MPVPYMDYCAHDTRELIVHQQGHQPDNITKNVNIKFKGFINYNRFNPATLLCLCNVMYRCLFVFSELRKEEIVRFADDRIVDHHLSFNN